MDMKRHLKSALKQLGFDKPRKAQIIPMNTLDAEQDAIIIAATGSGKQVIYETVGLAHSDTFRAAGPAVLRMNCAYLF